MPLNLDLDAQLWLLISESSPETLPFMFMNALYRHTSTLQVLKDPKLSFLTNNLFYINDAGM
jgi:hypothetical protein